MVCLPPFLFLASGPALPSPVFKTGVAGAEVVRPMGVAGAEIVRRMSPSDAVGTCVSLGVGVPFGEPSGGVLADNVTSDQ